MDIHIAQTKGPWLLSRRGRGGRFSEVQETRTGMEGILNEKKSIDLPHHTVPVQCDTGEIE